jgi:hypothetical protein
MAQQNRTWLKMISIMKPILALLCLLPGVGAAQTSVILGNTPITVGTLAGSGQAWANQLLESVPGDISDITWRSSGNGTQTSGIWIGNTRNFLGISTEATRALDPPNVVHATSAPSSAGTAVLHFADTRGVKAGDFVNGSAAIPASATVVSTTATTVTLSASVTGSGVPAGTHLGFIAPGIAGAQNATFVLIKNTGSVKASNAILSLAWCRVPGTYCSGGNDVAVFDGSGPVKLVGREIDIDFGRRGRSDGNSGGLFINVFNGSAIDGAGNGPAVQLGGVNGYWTAGFVCGGVARPGSCFVANTMATLDSLLNTANVGAYSTGAIVVQNNNGSNGQLIAFRGTGNANSAISMNAANNLVLENFASGNVTIRPGGVSSLVVSRTSAAFATDVTGTNFTASGSLRANTGFSANGTAGASATISVRKGDGSGACNIVFTLGLFTSTTC